MSATSNRRLDDRYTVLAGDVYLSGLQALVRLPLDVHRHDARHGMDTHVFISGYEGSPLGGYDLELLRNQALLDDHKTVLRQGLNEELAANAVQGTQQALTRPNVQVEAVTGFWYGKAPGLDRATDAIRHANLSGTHPRGGVVALVGDDTLAKSSTVPSSSEMALAELAVPTLVPADAQDVLDLGLHAVMLSRVSGLWTGFKVATNVADATSTAHVAPDRITPVVPDLTFDGVEYRHQVTAQLVQPVLGQLEASLYHRRLVLAARYARANSLNPITGSSDVRLGIVAAGATYLDVCQALAKLGLDPSRPDGVRVLKLGMVYPLDADTIREFATGLREIVVVEEKRSFVESGLKDILFGCRERPLVSGKTDPDGIPLLRPDGDLNPDLIAAALARRFGAQGVRHATSIAPARAGGRTALPLAVRTPFFCSGCPHNRSTQVPTGSLVGVGIGCHGMAALLPAETVGDVLGLTQMGGEGAPWIGMSGYVPENHMFQNLGDGTFHHSGSLAIRAAVASDVNVTFKLLYNSAVAMTGGQQAVGQLTVPQIVQLMLAEGVRKVVVTTDDVRRYRRVRLPSGVRVVDRADLLRVQEELRHIPGVTALIHDQECATELRRKRKRRMIEPPQQRVFINERVCEGCGDCGVKSNCLSVQPVETEYGRKTRIHQPSCNQDLSCLEGDCPSFLTVTPGAVTSRTRTLADLDSDALPAPRRTGDPEAFTMRITGIGGTGVVTVAQILATAAGLDGRSVRAMDQTGLAQKGGAVVSDVKITAAPTLAAAKLASGECDLYLGCDALVASSPANLTACSPDRTTPVISTAQVPTGHMVINAAATFPQMGGVVDQIASSCRNGAGVYVDAHALTRELFGDDQFANIFLVGVAYQSSLLPIAASRIEEAIGLNGVAVDANIQAFRRGRQFVAAPDVLAALVAGPHGTMKAEAKSADWREGSVDDLVDARMSELVAYQNRGYAERYRSILEPVRIAEMAAGPGGDRLYRAAAQYLFKLMAYKDEYEVARLSRDPELVSRLRAEFGDEVRFSFRLHPPILRALGLNSKVSLGPWFRHVFTLLYALRRVRGTRLDVFGHTRARRLERSLVTEYIGLLSQLAHEVTPGNYDVVVALAETPDLVRGYEGVKEASVARYHARVAELRSELTAAPTAVPSS